jgi:hypothetical protein
VKRRQEWFEEQVDLDPERLVFIDETPDHGPGQALGVHQPGTPAWSGTQG